MRYPVVFELEDGEANGTVHVFCSERCVSQYREGVSYDGPMPVATGESDLSEFGCPLRCEACGFQLVEE